MTVLNHPVSISNQEMMLKKGLAWHYSAYDQRPEFARVSTILILLIFVHTFFLEISLF